MLILYFLYNTSVLCDLLTSLIRGDSMPKVYFNALAKTVAGTAAGKIVDLLNFSFLDKMMQMVASWTSFLVSRCQGPSYTIYQCFQSQVPV